MTNIKASGHNTHGKSEHHNISIQDCLNNAKIDNSMTAKLDSGTYKSDHEEKESNNSNTSFRKKIIIRLSLIAFVFLQFYIGFMLLSFVLFPLYTNTNDYDAEIQIIDINNDIEKTRYQHIIMDTSDMHIEQQEYDYKTLSFEDTQVSKESNLSFK